MYYGERGSSNGKGLYRSRSGIFFGVCKGLAKHLDFSVFWMRVLWIAVPLFTVVTTPLAIIAYIVAAIVMKPEPVMPFQNDSEREFYNSYTSSRTMAVNRLKRTYENLDRRIQRMESIVTSPDFDWDRRLSQGK